MTKIDLRKGDSFEVLKTLDENSIDAIITDPPYGISFMGAGWDAPENIAFDCEFWKLALRVLKPGGHLAAFSSTRTYHRLAVAIEDAGFEVRDQLAWVYGCLDDTTKAVTTEGVVSYNELKIGDMILSYDIATRAYRWEPIEEVYTYNIKDTVYRISTDYGDQIVSRNHRCIIKQSGSEEFVYAEEAARQYEVRVPILEDLPSLLSALPESESLPSGSKQGLFERLSETIVERQALNCDANRDAQREIVGGMRRLRSKVLPQYEMVAGSDTPGLFEKVQRHNTRPHFDHAFAQRTPGLDGTHESFFVTKVDGRQEPGVERGSHLQATEGQLLGCDIRSMSERLSRDVSQRRLRDGTSPYCGDGNRTMSDKSGSGSPYRSSAIQQFEGEFDAVCNKQRSQEIREWSGHRSVVGRIKAERYDGVVWCVKVRTGAFVAVRNGMAFPTGNSGFPKSMDVSKAIDKAAGATREVVGTRKTCKGDSGTKTYSALGAFAQTSTVHVTEPATAEAKQWEGWGTSLKPAWETICLARKPLDQKTVAKNVLKHGTGALNIDACRVGMRDERVLNRNGPIGYGGSKAQGAVADGGKGRWPANLCHDGSDEVLAAFPETKSGEFLPHHAAKGKSQIGTFDIRDRSGEIHPTYGDSGSAARFFASFPREIEGSRFMYCPKAGKGDRAESKHPTVKPVALMRWLCRLITPPGGTILDPFAGTGTTAQAAHEEGFDCILIEREAEYQADIIRRFALT